MQQESKTESIRDTDESGKDTQLEATVSGTKLDNEPKEIKLPLIDK